MTAQALRQMGPTASRRLGIGSTPPNAIPYKLVALPVALQTGLRYRIGFQQTFGYDPGNPISYRADQEMRAAFNRMFTIESLDPQQPAQYIPGLDQWIQPWVLQGVASVDGTIDSSTSTQLLLAGVQATGNTAIVAPVAPGSSLTKNWSASKVVTWGITLGVLAGVGWGSYRVYKARHVIAEAF